MSNFTYDLVLTDSTDDVFYNSTRKGAELVMVSTNALTLKLQYTDDAGSTWVNVVGAAGGSGYRNPVTATNGDAPNIATTLDGGPLLVIPGSTSDRQWRVAVDGQTNQAWAVFKTFI